MDAVILATHSDVSLRILGDGATADEKAVLKAIPYNANDIWLHTDPSLMPKRKACWTSWNFLGKSGEGAPAASWPPLRGNGLVLLRCRLPMVDAVLSLRFQTVHFDDTSAGENDTDSVCVTYWLNLLQNLPPEAPDMFVTLNPIHEPAPETVIRRMSLDHPVFSEGSVAAQHRLPSIQGTGGVFLCGAWAGYGFHEDGLKAAMSVVSLHRTPM